MTVYEIQPDGTPREVTDPPTRADLVQVVRCGDCRYYDEIIHACDHPCVTPLRGDCPENWIFSCFDNDFCAWGEHKEVDE